MPMGEPSGEPRAAPWGDVAQLEEHLLCKQGVVGSIPIVSTKWAFSWVGVPAR